MRKFFFGLICSVLLIACDDKTSSDSATNEPPSVSSADKKPATEVLDPKEADGVKAAFAALSKGDVDAMLTNYADDAKHFWSGGDSAVGKAAIADYWKGRWKLIDSLTFSETIVLPIQINESPSPSAPAGKWVLAWTFSHVKYKNGKKINFWAHTDYYFNDAGKVSTVIQYIDRVPIMEATKGIVVK